MQDIIKKADILIEALPYIHAFRKKVAVIKYGGSILGDERIRRSVLEDIVFLNYIGLRPILVHGGGPTISERMKEEGKKTEFIDGMRVTDEGTLKIVSEELKSLNQTIVKEIDELKGHAVSIFGEKDIIRAIKKKGRKDLGFVGTIARINKKPIRQELEKEHIPVITPMGLGRDKNIYNVNADEAGSAIAATLAAEKFVLLTNVKGIMRNPEDESSLISTLTVDKAKDLIKEKVIQEGMIPKVKACIKALKHNVKKTHIIDARIPHALLLEIFTDKGVGTEIIK